MNATPSQVCRLPLGGRCTTRACAVLAITLTTLISGCSQPGGAKKPEAQEQADAAPSPPDAADYKRVARLFCESLLAGNYPAAYELTSGGLHKRLSAEKFDEACKAAVEQYGEAVQLGPVKVERTEGLAGTAAAGQYEFPAEIPDDDRLAWVHVAMALDVDEDQIIRCYDCWMLLENDGGKARIGHFRFTWCD